MSATQALARVRRTARAWLIRWLAAPLLAAGSALAAGVDCLPQAVPGYAQPKPESRDSVVVFLHGLHGDGIDTWTDGGYLGFGKTAWPCLLLADTHHFPGTKAYLASYRSVMLGQNPSIRQVAKDLLSELVANGVFGHDSISFVAHSMGGLVLARLLTEPELLNADQRSRIRLVVFAGTPAQPTEAAAICAKWGINATQCGEMSNSDDVDRLWQRWDSLPMRPPTWCLAEGQDTVWLDVPPWLRIVPETSAFRPCRPGGQTQTAFGFNHSALVKPASATSRPHGFLQIAFGSCVKPHLGGPSLAEEEAPHAQRLRGWFTGLVNQLEPAGANWRLIIGGTVAEKTNRFFVPQGGTATLDPQQYASRPVTLFADDLEKMLRHVLDRDVRMEWARPIDRLSARLSDGRVDRLMSSLMGAGDLQPGDLLIALKPSKNQPDVLWLLAVRPGPAGPGLVGALALPVPKTCLA